MSGSGMISSVRAMPPRPRTVPASGVKVLEQAAALRERAAVVCWINGKSRAVEAIAGKFGLSESEVVGLRAIFEELGRDLEEGLHVGYEFVGVVRSGERG